MNSFYSHLIWFGLLFFLYFLDCCTTAAAAIKVAIFFVWQHREAVVIVFDSSRVPGFLSCQFQVQVQRAPHKTHWPLTPTRAWAQTSFAKEIFGQKSVANKNCCCCCCCCVIVVAIGHHCAARRVAPYLPASAGLLLLLIWRLFVAGVATT